MASAQANATSDLLNQVVHDSPYLRVIGRSGNVTTLRGTNPNTGIAERVTVATRQLADEHLIYLLFVTPDRERDAACSPSAAPGLQNLLEITA